MLQWTWTLHRLPFLAKSILQAFQSSLPVSSSPATAIISPPLISKMAATIVRRSWRWLSRYSSLVRLFLEISKLKNLPPQSILWLPPPFKGSKSCLIATKVSESLIHPFHSSQNYSVFYYYYHKIKLWVRRLFSDDSLMNHTQTFNIFGWLKTL